MTEQAALAAPRRARRAGTALAECAGVTARYWITVGIPYVILVSRVLVQRGRMYE